MPQLDLSNITVRGPFWTAQAEIIGGSLTMPPVRPRTRLLAEDFAHYDDAQDPTGWRDFKVTGQRLRDDDSLFQTAIVDGNTVFGTASNDANIFSVYDVPGIMTWSNYVVTGRMRFTNTRATIGIVVCGQHPEDQNHYYWLGRTSQGKFRLNVQPTNGHAISGDQSVDYLTPHVNTWYRFRIEVANLGDETAIRAKVWPDDSDEPDDFHIDATDSGTNRLRFGTVGVYTASQGAKYVDDIRVERLPGTLPSAERVLLDEDFSRYVDGQDPAHWRDTKPNNSFSEDDSLFKIATIASERVFGTTSTRTNIHSHYDAPDALTWSNYAYSGRMLMTDEDGGIGITFFSRYPTSRDDYYRLRRYEDEPAFHIAPHPHNERTVQGDADSGVEPEPNKWYRFYIEVADTATRTLIQAKVWEEGRDEPPDFQINAYDDSADRLRSGTIGLWSHDDGEKYFDDLKVERIGATTAYQAFRNLFVSDQPRPVLGEDEMLVPGTLRAMCFVRSVEIHPADASYVWQRPATTVAPTIDNVDALQQALDEGLVNQLLLHIDPAAWTGNVIPPLTCTAGHISLDGMTPPDPAKLNELYRILNLEPAQPNLTDRSGPERLPGARAVHASGMSIYGAMQLPWLATDDSIAAPFQVARVFPDPVLPGSDQTAPAFRLTVERARLTATEQVAFINAWSQFSVYINPHFPLNGLLTLPSTTNWVTIEIPDPLSVPRLFWVIQPWQPQTLPVNVERGEVNLLLSDQQPYSDETPPTSLARIIPDIVCIHPLDNEGKLRIDVDAVAQTDTTTGKLTYDATFSDTEVADGIWEETFVARELTLAYDPVETPRTLREHQNLPTPEWSVGDEPLAESVLWSFMPLEDGWAQLPMLNLTEQIYLDADLANSDIFNEIPPPPIAQGAVAFGNNQPQVLAAHENEQAWIFTFINARNLDGAFMLEPTDDGFAVRQIHLALDAPDVAVNGLFWLSSGHPTVTDALPDHEDWVAGLASFALETVKPGKELFPPALVLQLDTLTFSARRNAGQNGFPLSAHLAPWNFRVQANEDTLRAMVKAGVLPPDALAKRLPPSPETQETDAPATEESSTEERMLPLVWRRHPALPMVQALPLTQNQSPPSHPSASRQLAPFALKIVELAHPETDVIAIPSSDWQFGVVSATNGDADNGAAQWPRLLGSAQPAHEWRNLFDLPLAALSLPGLLLTPHLASAGNDTSDNGFLPWHYRFDLPYTDEINALAQLPQIPRDPQDSSPLPDAPPPEAVQPLTRETLAEHWQRLSTRANLAAAAAVDAFTKDRSAIQNLVEPHVWSVQPVLAQSAFPGELVITDAVDTNVSLTLCEQSALKGVSGTFTRGEDGIRHVSAEETPAGEVFAVTANSMAAVRGENGLRDQRGLYRGASVDAADLLRTPVSLDGEANAYELISTLTTIFLNVSDGQSWLFWYRDLPVTDTAFERSNVTSHEENTDDPDKPDINDPEALSRRFNYLNGYEWRLAVPKSAEGDSAADDEVSPSFLTLHNLHFYPLTLERVTFDGDAVSTVVIKGRLQLPLSEPQELTDFSNAVIVTFTRNDASALAFSSIALEPRAVGEWPLALTGGEGSDAPHFFWDEVTLNTAENTIEIRQATLAFFLFDELWAIEWPQPIAFSPTANPTIAPYLFFEAGNEPQRPVYPEQVNLALDVTNDRLHSVSLDLRVHLGNQTRAAFDAGVRFHLLGGNSGAKAGDVEWRAGEGQLFGQLSLEVATGTTGTTNGNSAILYTDRSLQFRWTQYRPTDIGLQLLPGMHLLPEPSGDTTEPGLHEGPGFAVLTFDVARTASGIPALELRTAFVEVLLTCQWGAFLQRSEGDAAVALVDDPTQIYGSSAGELTFGYTTQFDVEASAADRWQESFLLNGFMEVTDLISWPHGLRYDVDEQWLLLPSARSGTDNDETAIDESDTGEMDESTTPPELRHTRHTMRILFNQHEIVSKQVVVGEGALLFALPPNTPWQFLAVVEHQLIDVQPNVDGDPRQFQLGDDRRWTALQEVRLIEPQTLKEVLQSRADQYTLDPVSGIALLGAASGGLLTELLRNPLLSELDALASTNALMVEASAPHWVRQTPITGASPTSLQFLPNGSQRGILSSPADYLPQHETESDWLLLVTPFLGRLQVRSADRVAGDDMSTGDSLLQVDPVLTLERQRAANPSAPLPSLLLALTNRGDDAVVELAVSLLDTAYGSAWSRLDPTALEENWFRLQNPLPEPVAGGLQSVTAALPDTPARLSRMSTLENAFRAFRRFYPPQQADTSRIASDLDETILAEIVWREDSLLVSQSVSSVDVAAPYAWHLFGVLLVSSRLATVDTLDTTAASENIQYYPAATLLPARSNEDEQAVLPLSFSVSPYLGLEFQLPASVLTLRLISAELLCLDRTSGQLLPTASHLWEMTPDSGNLLALAETWARETHARLCPDSPVAVLRYRQIEGQADMSASDAQTLDGAPIRTTYAFAIVSGIQSGEPLLRRVFRLRSQDVATLRFREGQFGGFDIPTGVRTFELAPPQVAGVQPIYLTAADDATAGWPWGVSTLRVSVAYSQDNVAIIGHASLNNNTNSEQGGTTTLWWQSPQHVVQFRSALTSGLPGAGLPPIFRAPAIKSLLPVLPQLPLPPIDAKTELNEPDAEPDKVALKRWQPVLPGTMRYLLLGNRAGTMLALRHQLLRQSGLSLTAATSAVGDVLVSGSVPVQHRVPRPVSLPDNAPAPQEKQLVALQPWASHFEPNVNMRLNSAPEDEAFFAACGDDPARRLVATLASPVQGAIPMDWETERALVFDVDLGSTNVQDWSLLLNLTDGEESFAFDISNGLSSNDTGKVRYIFRAKGDALNNGDEPPVADAGNVFAALQNALQSKAPGDLLFALLQVAPANAADDFKQTLRFPLRAYDSGRVRLPLAPNFLHFEDPEYNRQLASASAHATTTVKVTVSGSDPELHSVTLSADRKTYNPDSELAMRYDWDDERAGTASLVLKQISAGIPRTLTVTNVDGSGKPLDVIAAGGLIQFSLRNLQSNNESFRLNPGDVLQLTLSVTNAEAIAPAPINLTVDIVTEPVVPVPQSAFGLLRWHADDENQIVECVRFAWGPPASRIELICPDDLRTEVVRRRAVYQWMDSARPQSLGGYAVQKIAPSGATHFPSPVRLELI